MILVDTSVWIDHLRKKIYGLDELLDQQKISVHPFVIGEIALGNIRDRKMFLESLRLQPKATKAMDSEVLTLVEHCKLFGQGVGYVDAHLLASAKISKSKLWTHDKRLQKAAEDCEVERFEG